MEKARDYFRGGVQCQLMTVDDPLAEAVPRCAACGFGVLRPHPAIAVWQCPECEVVSL